jgi:hypothetical protein
VRKSTPLAAATFFKNRQRRNDPAFLQNFELMSSALSSSSASSSSAAAAAAFASCGGFKLETLRALLAIPSESRCTRDILLIARQMAALPCFQGIQGETLVIAAATAHRKVAPPDSVLAAAGETSSFVSVIISGTAEIRFRKTKKEEPAKAHIDDIIDGEWRKTSLLGSVIDQLVLLAQHVSPKR